MVGCRTRSCKRASVTFADPPWDEQSEEWQRLDRQVPADHVAREIVAAMPMLDLSCVFESYTGCGSAPYRPELMLRIALIEIRAGRHSPTQWHENNQVNQALQWAGLGIQPSRTCWHNFFHRIRPCLDELNRQVLAIARREAITTGERASLDGSTVAANASRHRLLNGERLQGRLDQLQAADATVEGPKPEALPAWMARTPAGRADQQQRCERAQQHLEELLEVNQARNPAKRQDPKKIVVSASDPEAALGRDKEKVFRPLYNVQFVVDVDSPLVFSYQVFAQATDAGTLRPMLDRTQQLLGGTPNTLLVDAGYVTGADLASAAAAGVTLYGPWMENDYSKAKKAKNAAADGKPAKLTKDQFTWVPAEQQYRCPQGQPLPCVGSEERQRSDGQVDKLWKYRCASEHCRACPLKERCTTSAHGGRSLKRSEHEELIDAHKARMATDEGKAIYRLRKQTVERSFADVKEHRRLRRFWGRGRDRPHAQVGLAVLAHNLLEVHRAPRPATTDQSAAVTP